MSLLGPACDCRRRPARYYASLVKFFEGIVDELGAGEALEQYVFAPAANGNGADMLLRFVGGA